MVVVVLNARVVLGRALSVAVVAVIAVLDDVVVQVIIIIVVVATLGVRVDRVDRGVVVGVIRRRIVGILVFGSGVGRLDISGSLISRLLVVGRGHAVRRYTNNSGSVYYFPKECHSNVEWD